MFALDRDAECIMHMKEANRESKVEWITWDLGVLMRPYLDHRHTHGAWSFLNYHVSYVSVPLPILTFQGQVALTKG